MFERNSAIKDAFLKIDVDILIACLITNCFAVMAQKFFDFVFFFLFLKLIKIIIKINKSKSNLKYFLFDSRIQLCEPSNLFLLLLNKEINIKTMIQS